MTVTYTAQVATCRGLGCFWKLLFRWRGSIYKLLWPNLALYSVCYFTLSAMYRFVLQGEQKVIFEKISLYCHSHSDLIPVSFVLGFYVSIVIKRWWDQYMGIPWPDNLAMFVSTLVHGHDDRGRLMRRTILRYVNLCFVVTLCMMCPRVKKRFPTLDHLVEAGFMQPNERKIFADLEQKTSHPKYWMPLVWAGSIVTRARKEGRVRDDFSMKTLIDGLCTFRGQCGGMLNYDWISIPLVYTQVVTLAVYIFFLATLMGHQFLDPAKEYADQQVDLVVPVFTFLQFFFYMGWLKVAESLVNPFGEDDDDFEVNWLVDRNLQVSYLIVDEMHHEHPELVKDQYWDEVFPAELPYTAAAKQYQTGPPQGSTNLLEIPVDQTEFMPMETVLEESELKLLNDDDDEVMVDMDDIQLDLEGGSRKRRETHPMRILMGRKASVSSKLSVQSSSVAGGGGNVHGGGRSRIGEISEGIGRSLLGLSYSSSTTKGMSGSYRQKNLPTAQQPQTAFRPSGRKHSMLSMLTRMFHREDTNRGDLRSNLGSNASLRSHRRGPFGRSISRVSCSQANSHTSINRENTADFQDEIFKMSDLSICGSTENELQSAHQRQRKRGQQHQRHGRRKLSVRLSSVETSGDHASKEESCVRATGDDTPSTVASTPGDGDKDGMFWKRLWMSKEKRKGKETAKEARGGNEEEEIENDEDYEDEVRDEEEDNGIWFSKKKSQDTKKPSLNRHQDIPLKEEVSKSPIKSFRRGETGVDDISLVSDSSVKTSFYHGSWETLAGSKDVGSVTTVASSPTVEIETPATIPLIVQELQKGDMLGNVNHEAVGQGHEWLQSAESWAGSEKVNPDILQVGQSLGNAGSFLQYSAARIIVPKKSELPLKHVFEPRHTSFPALQSPPSVGSRSRVTSQLARGIAQMAAVKQEPSLQAQTKTQSPQVTQELNTNVKNANETFIGDTVAVQDSKGKLIECSSPKVPHCDSVKTILPPPNSPGGWHLKESVSNEPLIPHSTNSTLSNGHAASPTFPDQHVNLISNKLSDIPSPVASKLCIPYTDSINQSPPRMDQDVIIPISAKSLKDFLNPTKHTDESLFSDSKASVVAYGVIDAGKRPNDMEMEVLSQDELLDEDNFDGAKIPQESDAHHTESSHIFQPHVPSTAIPVPSMSPAHNPCGDVQQNADEGISIVEDLDSSVVSGFGGDASMDVVRAAEEMETIGGRRRMGGLRDFVELEPIEENAELGGHVASQNECESKKEALFEELDTSVKEDVPPETAV